MKKRNIQTIYLFMYNNMSTVNVPGFFIKPSSDNVGMHCITLKLFSNENS